MVRYWILGDTSVNLFMRLLIPKMVSKVLDSVGNGLDTAHWKIVQRGEVPVNLNSEVQTTVLYSPLLPPGSKLIFPLNAGTVSFFEEKEAGDRYLLFVGFPFEKDSILRQADMLRQSVSSSRITVVLFLKEFVSISGDISTEADSIRETEALFETNGYDVRRFNADSGNLSSELLRLLLPTSGPDLAAYLNNYRILLQERKQWIESSSEYDLGFGFASEYSELLLVKNLPNSVTRSSILLNSTGYPGAIRNRNIYIVYLEKAKKLLGGECPQCLLDFYVTAIDPICMWNLHADCAQLKRKIRKAFYRLSWDANTVSFENDMDYRKLLFHQAYDITFSKMLTEFYTKTVQIILHDHIMERIKRMEELLDEKE